MKQLFLDEFLFGTLKRSQLRVANVHYLQAFAARMIIETTVILDYTEVCRSLINLRKVEVEACYRV